MDDVTRGLYRKYEVKRLHDPTGKHKNCDYFVLDMKHDPFAIPALQTYERACRKKYPAQAKDLRAYRQSAIHYGENKIHPHRKYTGELK